MSRSVHSMAPAGPLPPRREPRPRLCGIRLRFLTAAWLGGATAFVWAAIAADTAALEFRRDIEPLLVKRCSECHGPDVQKSGLRLDSRAAALKPAKSGRAAVVPGKPDESELLARVTTADDDDVMPPKGARLTPAEVAALRRWIQAGAEWPEWDAARHWAFAPVTRPAPPALAESRARVVNDIDRFVQARLAREGLALSREADRATLIRRLSLDLIGLPPSWTEVQAFVGDRSPDAYERLVDRLLQSVHHGEHMARWWLDLARYADSNGYQVDLTRSMWPYRDWVIRAFNANMPFDQFTIEQIAGDLLPNATLEQHIATGFNRNTKINDEGGSDNEEHRVKAVKDRVATVGTTWLGLTLTCAECHSHKYDPVSHEEYYRFYAFFNQTEDRGSHNVEPSLPVPAPPVQRQVEYLHGEIARVRAALADAERSLPAAQARWEEKHRDRPSPWTPLALEKVASNGGSSYTNLPDASVLATGINPIYDTITFEADTDAAQVTGVLLEVLPDPSLPKNGPGRWGQTGNFILDEFTLSVVRDGAAAPIPVAWGEAVADWEQRYYRAEHAVDGNPKTGWAIGPQFGRRHFLVARLREPLRNDGRLRLVFRFDHYHGSSHTIGRFRVAVSGETDPGRLWPVPESVRETLRTPLAQRPAGAAREVQEAFRSSVQPVRELERELYRLNERELDLASTRYQTLVMRERAEPRETFVHVRGNFLDKGAAVTTGVPAFLPPLADGVRPDRLALAHWLVDPRNPLTARVTVNRLWERFLGTGLVKTSEDFGRQGEAPSHPELLDWLADGFVRSGWDLRAMQKQIVMSATYRQDAASSAAALEKDPYNRWLSHGPRFRLDAETIRDNALAVSGLLNRDVGGPSVYPEQVANLWKEIGFLRPEIGMDEWPVSIGPERYRRGMYTFWRRVCTYPTFATFDAPSRENCTSRRPRTNTPLQALAGLNDPTLLEAARAFAGRVQREGGARTAQQAEFALREALLRPPTRAEVRRVLAFYEQQQAGFIADPAAAARLLGLSVAPAKADLNAAALAAWTLVANVLLNLDETLTKG